METICIWTAVSSDELDLLTYTMDNAFKDNAVTHIVIVVTGPRIRSDMKCLSEKYKKVRIKYKYFGHGYDIPIEKGGYNQILARNFALKEAKETGADWLIQYDADEFFDGKIFRKLQSSAHHLDAIYCNYYTLVGLQDYWYEENRMKKSGHSSLYDPRLRIWRASLQLQYHQGKTNIGTEFVNVTRHCGVNLKAAKNLKMGFFRECSIYHLHCFLGKRHTQQKTSTKSFHFALPGDLLVCLSSIQDEIALN